MNQNLSHLAAALALTACASIAGTAQAAALPYEQAPLQVADALANGSDGQAPLLAETFTFSDVATTLSWWGTPGGGFELSLTPGAGTGPIFVSPTVQASPAGFNVVVDVDDDQQADTVEVLRFSIDLASLPGGTYTFALRETASDPLGRSWFWLHGAPGDGASISGLGERDQQSNPFDLSLRIDGERGGTVPEPGTLAAAGLGLALAMGVRRRRQHTFGGSAA